MTDETTRFWSVYIIRSADNRLYTGISTDVYRRLAQHQAGKGAKALRGRGALALVFYQKLSSHSQALRMEYRIKQLRKSQKERLIDQTLTLEDLMIGLQGN